MPNTETTVEEEQEQPKFVTPPLTVQTSLTVIAAWLVPGAGHFIQKKWVRGLLLFLSVTTLFVMGLLMSGKVYKPNTGDLLDILGFVGDIGAGGLYFLSRMMDWGDVAIQFAVADYGTKFIVIAGLLNVITIVDAYNIAIGRKP